MLFNQLSVLSFVLLGSPRRFREGDGLVSANIGKISIGEGKSGKRKPIENIFTAFFAPFGAYLLFLCQIISSLC